MTSQCPKTTIFKQPKIQTSEEKKRKKQNKNQDDENSENSLDENCPKSQCVTKEHGSYQDEQRPYKSSSIIARKGDTSQTQKTKKIAQSANDHYQDEYIDLEEIDDYLDNQETEADTEAENKLGSYKPVPGNAKMADVKKCTKPDTDDMEDVLYFKKKKSQNP